MQTTDLEGHWLSSTIWLQGTITRGSQDPSLRKVQWVSTHNMSKLGLSSGVKKVWKMVTSQAIESKQMTGPPEKSWKQQKLKL